MGPCCTRSSSAPTARAGPSTRRGASASSWRGSRASCAGARSWRWATPTPTTSGGAGPTYSCARWRSRPDTIGRSMWFSADSIALTVAQAACIALPAAGVPRPLERFRAGAWALALPLSIALVVGGIALLPSTADFLTWVAFLLVPPGCALALGWAARGARRWLAVLAAPLLALAWAAPDGRPGQVAAIVLIAGSAITLGRLLAGAAPLTFLKVGVIAMATVDAVLVFSNNLQAPNAVLEAAAPGFGLPQLQSAAFGHAGLGYGDFFAAAVVGGVLAAERGPQLPAAAAMILVGVAWDQLFLVYDVLPATIPPALVLIGAELWRRRAEIMHRVALAR